MNKFLLIFPSVHDVIRAERICREMGRRVQVVPVPREISSECGMALEMEDRQRESLLATLHEKGMEVRLLEREGKL